MSITSEAELLGMQKASEAVALTLKEMRNYAQPGMTTKQLDNYGATILGDFGVRSAPFLITNYELRITFLILTLISLMSLLDNDYAN